MNIADQFVFVHSYTLSAPAERVFCVNNLIYCQKCPHLWKSHEKQEWRGFGGKNIPRGTFLWNENPQKLVYVEKIFSKWFRLRCFRKPPME